MTAPGLRAFLALTVAAAAVVSAALLLAFGLPALASGDLRPGRFVALVLIAAAAGVGAGSILLFRLVARPIDRLLAAARPVRSGSGEHLPVLGDSGGLALPRAALAFERVAAQLEDERVRLAAKVEELTGANRALAEARESLVRSEKLATVGRLASGLAHEVGNPLGAIAGYVELARSRLPRDADRELADAIARIAAAASRIDRTVRDLLDFARPVAPSTVPLDLAAALDASLRLAKVQSRFRAVDVELDLPATLPRVIADEHHLSQVVLNLLLNAADAMRGQGRVRISARHEADRVRLDIADDGPGIPPADLPRVFDPFFTTKEPGQGTGLGLAISHRLVESFGGEIAVASPAGGGAIFTLRLRIQADG